MFKVRSTQESSGSFVGLRLTMAVMAFIAGASFCFAGEEWHKSAALFYVNSLPVPWFIYGVVLLSGGIFMFIERYRPVGFLLGAVLYTFFAICVWLGVLGGLHTNFFLLNHLHFPHNSVGSFYAACNITTLAALYWSALKHSIYVQVDPERMLYPKK